jgi:hypothetical protein
MIYHWRTIKLPSWPRCYISAWVPSNEELVQGNKSYAAEGDVTAVEIWKLSTTHPASLKTMSWNTRPERISLMGKVNFTSRYIQNSVHELDGQQLKWPTPFVDCSGMVNITIEIVCTSCRLKFEQIFSLPALGMFSAFCLEYTHRETNIMMQSGFELVELA